MYMRQVHVQPARPHACSIFLLTILIKAEVMTQIRNMDYVTRPHGGQVRADKFLLNNDQTAAR